MKKEVKVIKKTASNFEYDETCKTSYEEIKDNQTCMYCRRMGIDQPHDPCLRCIFTCTCSDGKVISGHSATATADVYCLKQNGKI